MTYSSHECRYGVLVFDETRRGRETCDAEIKFAIDYGRSGSCVSAEPIMRTKTPVDAPSCRRANTGNLSKSVTGLVRALIVSDPQRDSMHGAPSDS